jgi:hypothetical protein
VTKNGLEWENMNTSLTFEIAYNPLLYLILGNLQRKILISQERIEVPFPWTDIKSQIILIEPYFITADGK